MKIGLVQIPYWIQFKKEGLVNEPVSFWQKCLILGPAIPARLLKHHHEAPSFSVGRLQNFGPFV